MAGMAGEYVWCQVDDCHERLEWITRMLLVSRTDTDPRESSHYDGFVYFGYDNMKKGVYVWNTVDVENDILLLLWSARDGCTKKHVLAWDVAVGGYVLVPNPDTNTAAWVKNSFSNEFTETWNYNTWFDEVHVDYIVHGSLRPSEGCPPLHTNKKGIIMKSVIKEDVMPGLAFPRQTPYNKEDKPLGPYQGVQRVQKRSDGQPYA